MKISEKNIFVDSCFFDSDYGLGEERSATDEIMKLFEQGKIWLYKPGTVKSEIDHRNTPIPKKKESNKLNYTIEQDSYSDKYNDPKYKKFKNIIVGNGKFENYEKDVNNIYEADRNSANHKTKWYLQGC